jgi:hypothetical protein
MYQEVVWRKGEERCERSLKAQPVQQAVQQPVQQAVQQPVQKAPLEQPVQQLLRPSKREEANHKLSDRYLVGQANFNPFMPTNNYVNDLEDQLNFLTPQKSM